jgi:hypothetical protein
MVSVRKELFSELREPEITRSLHYLPQLECIAAALVR